MTDTKTKSSRGRIVRLFLIFRKFLITTCDICCCEASAGSEMKKKHMWLYLWCLHNILSVYGCVSACIHDCLLMYTVCMLVGNFILLLLCL